jgi:hypothetical protein
MKIKKKKHLIHLIAYFKNQLHDCQAIRSTYHTTQQVTLCNCHLLFGRALIHNINFGSEKTGIEYKKENRRLSMNPIKKKTRVKFLMKIRLEAKLDY